MAFSLLDIEGMVYLHIPSNENGSLGRKVREHRTLDGTGPGRSRRSAQCSHQKARGQLGLDLQIVRQPSLLSERIIGNFVRGMGKGKVLNSAILGHLPTLFPHPTSGKTTSGPFSWQGWGCLLLHPQVSSSILLRRS